MLRPLPLPEPFAGEPFSVHLAIHAGISAERLKRQDLESPFWGVRVPKGYNGSVAARCMALSTRTPADATFSHDTAAQLWEMPLPATRALADPLHVSTPPGRSPVRTRGVLGHRLDLDEHEIVNLHGIRVTSPARTWIDLAPNLPTEDLIVLGDRLLWWRHPLCTREQLEQALRRRAGRPGVRRATSVVSFLSDRSDSPPESRFRHRFARAGLPPATPNRRIYSPAGQFLAMPDLTFEGYNEVFEYEGDYHRTDQSQWNKDIARVRRLEGYGWHSTRGSRLDLRDSSEVIGQLGRLMRARGWSGAPGPSAP
jgi:hypothetical protein